jgi:hypothetical protein
MLTADFLVQRTLNTLGTVWPPARALMYPLHRIAATLYLHGPAIPVGHLNVGFWQGRDIVDVCSTLTGVRSLLWVEQPTVCLDIIADRFIAVYYCVYALLVVYVLWWVLWGMAMFALTLPGRMIGITWPRVPDYSSAGAACKPKVAGT